VPMTREKLTDRYLDPIRELCQIPGSHRLVCGGDWFDKAHNSERTIQQSNHLMQRLEILVAGNHDHASRESALTSLQLLAGSATTTSPSSRSRQTTSTRPTPPAASSAITCRC